MIKIIFINLVTSATSTTLLISNISPWISAAPVTCAVSWMAVPRNIPALTGSSTNNKLAKNGYNTMPVRPKIVILATAYEISFSFASITGDVAMIAVTPQIPVPQAIKVPSLSDCCSFLVKYNVTANPQLIQITIKGTPQAPSLSASTKLNRNPSKIIPNLKAYFTERAVPSLKIRCKPTVFRIKIPRIMATNIPETGLALPSGRKFNLMSKTPINSAPYIPAIITKKQTIIPGNIEPMYDRLGD